MKMSDKTTTSQSESLPGSTGTSEEGEEDEEEGYSVKVSMEPNLEGKEWYQPLCLPMDRAFESKYLYRYIASRSVTPQEKVYMFLEHPSDWIGFLYHMIVYAENWTTFFRSS